jgi:hypothetical protein
VDEAAQDVGSLEVRVVGLTGRSRSGVGVGRCLLAEGPVRTVPVVVLDVLAEHGFEVTSSEDEHSVEAISPGDAHESLGDGVRPWRPDRGLDDPDALCGEDSVEVSGELCVWSQMRNLTAAARSASSMQMLRACWVTQSVAGLAVTPANRTIRVSWWMKKRT